MRTHIYTLDAVRFFAAFIVVLFHLAFYDWASPVSSAAHMLAGAASFPPAAPYTSFGWVGVEIFFVISGFVIANSANNSSPAAFARSRILRLYPAVWICAPITLAAWLVVGGETARHLADESVRTLSLWIFGPWLDGVYWSLAVEMVFYGIIFLLLLRGRFDRLPTVAWTLLSISAVYLIAVTAAPRVFASQLGWHIVEYSGVLQLRYGCFFALGIWMWLLAMRALRPSDVIGMSAALAIGLLEIIARTRGMTSSEILPGVPVAQMAPAIVWIAAMALMLAVALQPDGFEPHSQRMKSVLRHMGLMTYPLYLTHAMLGAFLIRELARNGIDPWMALATAVVSVLSLAFAIAFYGEPIVRVALRTVVSRGEANLRAIPSLTFLFRPGGRYGARERVTSV